MSIKSILKKITDPKALVKVLVVVILASSCLTSGMIAKYSTKSVGTDAARVAKFASISISETSDSYTEIVPGSDFAHQVYVTVSGSPETKYKTVLEVKVPAVDVNGSREDVFSFDVAPEWTFVSKSNLGSNTLYTYMHTSNKFTGTAPVFWGNISVSSYFAGMPDSSNIEVAASIEQIS